ncbi:MAG TPA: uracil-DNA glycosylase [Polyangia bacterium]|jgi:DNA polymerase
MGTDDEAPADARAELRALVGQVRTNFGARQRAGLLGIPLRPSARKASAVPAPADAKPAAAAVSASGPEPPDTRQTGALGLAVVREDLGDCKRCKLAPTRTNLVFGVGNPNAHLVFVGEAPGADEDAQGEPFVGKAGQLLTKMIEAMGYARQDVYICNILKCRPPGNRNPEPDEIEKCEPFLKSQLAALRPRVIVALGKFAAQCLLRDDTPISRLRGSFRSYEGIQLMPTFHPAYLLRDPSKKKEAWADLKAVNAALKRLGLDPPRPPAGES